MAAVDNSKQKWDYSSFCPCQSWGLWLFSCRPQSRLQGAIVKWHYCPTNATKSQLFYITKKIVDTLFNTEIRCTSTSLSPRSLGCSQDSWAILRWMWGSMTGQLQLLSCSLTHTFTHTYIYILHPLRKPTTDYVKTPHLNSNGFLNTICLMLTSPLACSFITPITLDTCGQVVMVLCDTAYYYSILALKNHCVAVIKLALFCIFLIV